MKKMSATLPNLRNRLTVETKTMSGEQANPPFHSLARQTGATVHTFENTAADRYLLYLGLWDGLQGRQRGKFFQITEANLADRACAYYGYAADLAKSLPAPSSRNAKVFQELSQNFGMYLGILLSMRGDVMNLHPVLTPGEEFHLTGGALAA